MRILCMDIPITTATADELLNSLIFHARAYGGGFLEFQETPFDSKTISKITYLNKYTIINTLASYAYLSANTIQYLSETFMQVGLLL